MCEVPPRRLRTIFSPVRVAVTLLAAAAVVLGMEQPTIHGIPVVLLGIAVGALVFLFPAIREVEFGFPTGVKLATSLRNREDELRQAFENSRGDTELCTQLLCDDPSLASRLLEAAWAKTMFTWRGPVTPELRHYVLCLIVELLTSHNRWIGGRPEPPASLDGNSDALSPLTILALPARIVVVLHDFAGMPLAQIATLTGRTTAEVRDEFLTAQQFLDRRGMDGKTL